MILENHKEVYPVPGNSSGIAKGKDLQGDHTGKDICQVLPDTTQIILASGVDFQWRFLKYNHIYFTPPKIELFQISETVM